MQKKSRQTPEGHDQDESELKPDNGQISKTHTMDLKPSLIKCKGCLQALPINSLKKHLEKRQSCKIKYTVVECKELDELIMSYRREQRAAKYRENKLQKV